MASASLDTTLVFPAASKDADTYIAEVPRSMSGVLAQPPVLLPQPQGDMQSTEGSQTVDSILRRALSHTERMEVGSLLRARITKD